MTDYIDAILHIADLPALTAALAKDDPSKISPEGAIYGFASTPATTNGAAALIYVRLTPDEAEQWRGTPLVTILAETPYTGSDTSDRLYSLLELSSEAMTLYDSVYPRNEYSFLSEDGQVITNKPHFRFGVLSG
jgi:hypothetical protein